MSDISTNPGSVVAEAVDLIEILEIAVERGASDVHLKVGRPPILRFDGQLEPLDMCPRLGTFDLEDVVTKVAGTSRARLDMFERTGELDTAYQPAGLPRFRVNAFRQRGEVSVVFRVIPRTVPDFASLRLPPGVEKLAEEQRGLVLVTGA